MSDSEPLWTKDDDDSRGPPIEIAENWVHYLTPTQRARWRMVEKEGLSVAEAARREGVTWGAVNQSVERACERLEDIVEEKEE